MYLLLHSILLAAVCVPAQPPAKPVDSSRVAGGQAFDLFEVVHTTDGKQPATLDQAITQALMNHPDMRLAEAELRVAEAKLAQARVQVSQKVTEAFHRLEKERADVELAKANWDRMTQLLKSSAISQEEYRVAQNQLASAKARLATTESAWKQTVGSQGAKTGMAPYLEYRWARVNPQVSLDYGATFSKHLNLAPNPVYEVYLPLPDKSDTGTAAGILDQLKSKLVVRVKLDKQTNIDMEQAFQKVTEGAGLKVRVKLPVTENKTMYKNITRINLEASEFPLYTWLQLIVDEMNSYQVDPGTRGQEGVKGYVLYVREYGLLLTTRDLAPPDAITVQELWKQTQFEKATREAKKAQESAAPKK